MGKGKRNKNKGTIAEQIVAEAFSAPDVHVQRNVRLPSIRRKGGSGGLRELDVLITGRLAGQTIHFAIECKNYSSKVDSPNIDAFIGKLLDVGLPTQTSMFVSTSGFTRPAIERAYEVGMKTLILNGLDPSRTKEVVFEALQSHIFMLCSLKKFSFKTIENEDTAKYTYFYNQSGQCAGFLADFLWKAWLRGTPPLRCGRYSYNVNIPDEWKYFHDGRRNSIHDLHVEYQVSAMTIQIVGDAITHQLVDASTGRAERQTWKVNFANDCGDSHPETFTTEEALDKYLTRQARARVTVGRVRLPKLIMNQGLLWPMPESIMESLASIKQEQSYEEFLRFVSSEQNNFFNFDGVYARFIDTMSSSQKISVKLEPD